MQSRIQQYEVVPRGYQDPINPEEAQLRLEILDLERQDILAQVWSRGQDDKDWTVDAMTAFCFKLRESASIKRWLLRQHQSEAYLNQCPN